MLSACTPTSEVVHGTSVTVALSQAFTSYNANTAFGSTAAANASIFEATNSSFVAYDETPQLVTDTSFGSYELVSENPLVVTYTVRDGIRWSDGTPVGAADLLLAWAANSTTLNDAEFDPTEFVDQETGRFTDDFPRNVVYFDGFTGNGLQLVTETPVIGDDGRSITMTYDEYFPDWRLVFEVGMPAHIVGEQALGVADPEQAKLAVIDAIQTDDRRDLAAISQFWNTGFTITQGAVETELFVGTGPYMIDKIVPGERVVLTVNPEYHGDHLPQFEEVIVEFIADPLQAVAAVAAGDVDIISPQPATDVAAALAEVNNISVEHGYTGTWERLDLQTAHSKNGQVENILVRKAFLRVVPRQEILDTLIRPLNPDAELRASLVFLPGSGGYDHAARVNHSRSYTEVDVAGAKRLLALAARESPALATPTICILFDPANPRRVAEFRLIADSAAEAGFRVTDCSSPDWRNLLGTAGSYDAALYALRETNLALTAVEAAYSSESTINNHTHYSNPEVDELISRAVAPASATERRTLLTRIDKIVWSDAISVPLYQFPSVTATSDRVTEVVHSPLAATALWSPWRWRPVVSEG